MKPSGYNALQSLEHHYSAMAPNKITSGEAVTDVIRDRWRELAPLFSGFPKITEFVMRGVPGLQAESWTTRT